MCAYVVVFFALRGLVQIPLCGLGFGGVWQFMEEN